MAFVGVKTNGFELATVITDYHVTSVGANQDVSVRIVPCVASKVCAVNQYIVLAAQLAPLDGQFGFKFVF
jgi:hypothetical protein